MLKNALKEWAVICQALATGQQALILRKGGLAEDSGEFRLEHKRFWLFPTYSHQQAAGIRPEGLPLLEQVERARPRAAVIPLSHFAEVAGVYRLRELLPALLLGHLHYWSEETIRQRFAYRTPGLLVLAVRVYRAAAVTELPNCPAYEGCRSWVELARELPTADATPVLSDKAMEDLHRSLDALLNPTALA